MAEDDYQKRYMAGEGHGLMLDRTRFKALAVRLGALGGVMMALATAIAVAAAVSDPSLFVVAGLIAVSGALMASSGLLFSVLRVSVTRDELHIQYGLTGPRIPIEDIVDVGVEAYDMWKYGGYGVKARSIDGRLERAYSLPTAENRVVRVVWREGEKKKSAVFSSEQPDAVAAAIQRAMAMKAGGGAFRVRVEEPVEEEEVAADAGEEKKRARRP